MENDTNPVGGDMPTEGATPAPGAPDAPAAAPAEENTEGGDDNADA